jgi:hypothetical protein
LESVSFELERLLVAGIALGLAAAAAGSGFFLLNPGRGGWVSDLPPGLQTVLWSATGAVFGLAAIWVVAMLLRRPGKLAVGHEGITDALMRFKALKVQWGEVRDIRVNGPFVDVIGAGSEKLLRIYPRILRDVDSPQALQSALATQWRNWKQARSM